MKIIDFKFYKKIAKKKAIPANVTLFIKTINDYNYLHKHMLL